MTPLKNLAAILGLTSVCILSGACTAPVEDDVSDGHQAVVAAGVTEISGLALEAYFVESGAIEGVTLSAAGDLEAVGVLESQKILDFQKMTQAFADVFKKAKSPVNFRYATQSGEALTTAETEALQKEVTALRALVKKEGPEFVKKFLPKALTGTKTISARALSEIAVSHGAARRVATALLRSVATKIPVTFTAAEFASGTGLVLSRANLIATVAYVSYKGSRFVTEKTGFDMFLVDVLLGGTTELKPPATWRSNQNDLYAGAKDKWRAVAQSLKEGRALNDPQRRAASLARSYYQIKFIESAHRPAQPETASLPAFLGWLSDSALLDDPKALEGAGLDAMVALQDQGVDWDRAVNTAIVETEDYFATRDGK